MDGSRFVNQIDYVWKGNFCKWYSIYGQIASSALFKTMCLWVDPSYLVITSENMVKFTVGLNNSTQHWYNLCWSLDESLYYSQLTQSIRYAIRITFFKYVNELNARLYDNRNLTPPFTFYMVFRRCHCHTMLSTPKRSLNSVSIHTRRDVVQPWKQRCVV